MNRRGLGSEPPGDGYPVEARKWNHYFSQSLINDFLMCPEKARHELLGDVPRTESPKMALGTAGHSAIEYALKDKLSPRGLSDFERYAAIMMEAFEERMYLTEFREDPKLGMEWAKRRGVSALSAWFDDICPQVKPAAVEKSFEYKLYEDENRIIYMKGTIDCVDEGGFIWDWKFSGSERKEWKDRRGSVQAAAYTKAMNLQRFKYAVMHEQGVQVVDLYQTPAHWAWLARQAVGVALLVEADLPMWPVNDSDWWCDAKWCNVFAAGQCKGQYFPERNR